MNANRQHRRNRLQHRIPLLRPTVFPPAQRPRSRPIIAYATACAAALDLYTAPRRSGRRPGPATQPPAPVPPPSPTLRPTLSLTMSYDPLILITMSIMTAPQQTIEFTRGEDVVIEVRMDRPTDITGWSIDFRIANQPGAPALIYKDRNYGITTVSSAKAILRITLLQADTLSLSESTTLSDDYGYVWHLRRTDPGFVKVLAAGEVIVNERATQ